MFGDVLDPSVMTARVRSGTIFGRARKKGRGLTREVRLGLAVGSGLCRQSREEREVKAWQQFSEAENVRRSTNYNVAVVIRWGVKRTPNAMKFDKRSIYTIIRPHANFHPIPRTFSSHLQNNISDMPRARASVVGLRTDNGENWRPGRMQVLKT